MPQLAIENDLDELNATAASLTAARRNWIAAQVLRSLRHGTNRAFVRIAALAPAVATPLFETTLAWCATSCDARVSRRARYVRKVLRRGRIDNLERRGQRIDRLTQIDQ